jgi:hypothetical protein
LIEAKRLNLSPTSFPNPPFETLPIKPFFPVHATAALAVPREQTAAFTVSWNLRRISFLAIPTVCGRLPLLLLFTPHEENVWKPLTPNFVDPAGRP